MKHEIQQVFATTAERLWDTYFFDEAFNEGLHERLGLRLDERSLQHEGAGPTLVVRRRLRYTARRMLPRLPAPLRRVLGQGTSIVETGDFCARRRRFSLRFELPGILQIVDCGGEFTWESLPGGDLRRSWTGRCESRLPVLGTRLARYMLGEMEGGLAESHLFLSRWIREHPVTAVLAAY